MYNYVDISAVTILSTKCSWTSGRIDLHSDSYACTIMYSNTIGAEFGDLRQKVELTYLLTLISVDILYLQEHYYCCSAQGFETSSRLDLYADLDDCRYLQEHYCCSSLCSEMAVDLEL